MSERLFWTGYKTPNPFALQLPFQNISPNSLPPSFNSSPLLEPLSSVTWVTPVTSQFCCMFFYSQNPSKMIFLKYEVNYVTHLLKCILVSHCSWEKKIKLLSWSIEGPKHNSISFFSWHLPLSKMIDLFSLSPHCHIIFMKLRNLYALLPTMSSVPRKELDIHTN